jgi:hypothetical protein
LFCGKGFGKTPPVDKIHYIVEKHEDPDRAYLAFINAGDGGLDLLRESGYYGVVLRLPLDK